MELWCQFARRPSDARRSWNHSMHCSRCSSPRGAKRWYAAWEVPREDSSASSVVVCAAAVAVEAADGRQRKSSVGGRRAPRLAVLQSFHHTLLQPHLNHLPPSTIQRFATALAELLQVTLLTHYFAPRFSYAARPMWCEPSKGFPVLAEKHGSHGR